MRGVQKSTTEAARSDNFSNRGTLRLSNLQCEEKRSLIGSLQEYPAAIHRNALAKDTFIALDQDGRGDGLSPKKRKRGGHSTGGTQKQTRENNEGGIRVWGVLGKKVISCRWGPPEKKES